ncbi:MAG: acyl-CoA dehydrogenase family protein [Acidimicrobiia bacterium]|nr:acyl-CoA dehydrogenase family protein [Acidimicrobiia bacterium]
MSTDTDLAREVKSWLDQNWDPDLTVAEWWDRLCDSGFGAPTWPEEWHGRGLSRDEARIVNETIRDAGALGPPSGLGMMLAGPTIIAHGSEEQKKRYLRRIVNGQDGWCQLFSEPGAGSDLASLQTRAVRDGDEWIVSGQKVWTSGGMVADLGMLIARTDVEVPKQKGISYFAIDMHQAGIDVRPLREMTGHALFSEVFLDSARVPHDACIGGVNNGWTVAKTTLANEREGLGSGGGGAAGGAVPGTIAGVLDQRVGDYGQRGRRGGAGVPGLLGGAPQMLLELVRERNMGDDPHIRQSLARLYSMSEIGRYTVMRARAAKAAGRGPGPEANTAKLAMSRMVRLTRDLGLAILGADGMLYGEDAPLHGIVQELALFSPAPSIYGGTDEIQKNIIGERVLQLPREPSLDHEVPFKDLKVGTQAG